MRRTRKVQVTLDETQYADLARIAERDGKKLAAVVRESIVRYCLGPETESRKRQALEQLFSVAAPVPKSYETWENEYTALKTKQTRPQRSRPSSS